MGCEVTGHGRKCEMCGRIFFYFHPYHGARNDNAYRCPACTKKPLVDDSPISNYSIGMRGGFSNGNIAKGLRK